MQSCHQHRTYFWYFYIIVFCCLSCRMPHSACAWVMAILLHSSDDEYQFFSKCYIFIVFFYISNFIFFIIIIWLYAPFLPRIYAQYCSLCLISISLPNADFNFYTEVLGQIFLYSCCWCCITLWRKRKHTNLATIILVAFPSWKFIALILVYFYVLKFPIILLFDISLINLYSFLGLDCTFNCRMVNFGKKLAANQIQEWKEYAYSTSLFKFLCAFCYSLTICALLLNVVGICNTWLVLMCIANSNYIQNIIVPQLQSVRVYFQIYILHTHVYILFLHEVYSFDENLGYLVWGMWETGSDMSLKEIFSYGGQKVHSWNITSTTKTIHDVLHNLKPQYTKNRVNATLYGD